MSWEERFYGKNSSLAARRFFKGFFLASLLTIYAIAVDFVPSKFWWLWGFCISLLITIVACHATYRAVKRGALKSQPMSPGKRRLGLIALPLYYMVITWMSFVYALPDIWTRLLGTDEQMTVTLQAERRPSRRSCDYRLYGDVLDRKFPEYLCISKEAFPGEDVSLPVLLVGKSSTFGFSIHDMYEPPDPE